jgi:hypothetical protein
MTKGSRKNNFIPLKRDIPSSSHFQPRLNRNILETPLQRGYSCGVAQSAQPNLS